MHEYRFLWPMFWGLFALAIILTRRFTCHRERMRALEMAERFAEKGIAAPEIVSRALERPDRSSANPEHFILGGMINIAVAAAMCIMAYVLASDDNRQGIYPLFGAAAFPGLIGIVLLGFGLTKRGKL